VISTHRCTGDYAPAARNEEVVGAQRPCLVIPSEARDLSARGTLSRVLACGSERQRVGRSSCHGVVGAPHGARRNPRDPHVAAGCLVEYPG
jgi:hypothetical protein